MEHIKFDLSKKCGKFKMLNATNGGPWHKRHADDQARSNFADYKALKLPYSRNHDSWYCAVYGGPFSHDITAIFPNFDADVNDPASYDFACTDESVLVTLDAGTKTFFRLGQSIEHQIKKHGTLPPRDYQKWAEICEHIIMHYTEGWADGFELDMPYWEIWNEPDLDTDDSPNKRTWGGTEADFFDMYEIAAKHLKSRFPHLKIGGPAIAGNMEWGERFLCEMQKRQVPIDFFSWHIYTNTPPHVVRRAKLARELLDKYGYSNAESILNEWNYVRGWDANTYPYTVMAIHGMKSAAFVMACLSLTQYAPVDMLMYYDTRPSVFCGLFDYYSYKPLKAYYPFLWFAELYELDAVVEEAETTEPALYSICGVDSNDKVKCIVTFYSENDYATPRTVDVDLGRDGEYDIYLLDAENDAKFVGTTKDLTFTLNVNSCIMIRER